ncbi:flagellar export chaperone FlgN [Thalassolituus sp. LLYu03]|uniref:flagellar export chaperone FlgN n=1 Tax=Thalassolituus sp. LLYu03 TaxID=3421656 RepID=UPI003D2D69AF
MSLDTGRLAQMLDEELLLTRDIHGILQQEKEALRSNDLDSLHSLQQSSTLRLSQLKDHAGQRLHWMQTNHLPCNADCLNHPDVAPAANIHRLWTQLEAQYRTNQTLSQQLSDIVLGARQRTLQKLRILRGQQNDPHLYDGKGKASSLNKGQGYIQA